MTVTGDAVDSCCLFPIARLDALWLPDPIRMRDNHLRLDHTHHEAGLVEVIEVAVMDTVFIAHILNQPEPSLQRVGIFAEGSLVVINIRKTRL